MNKTDSFSFSYSIGGPAAVAQEPELFAIGKLSEFQFWEDLILARNPRNGKKMALHSEVMNAMTFCGSFRSLDDHVSILMEGSDGSIERARAIRSVMKSVHEGGLTLSAKKICSELNPTAPEQSAAVKPVIVIITCDRPLALERLLDSLQSNCDLEQVHHCLVVDDSRNQESSKRNLELCRINDSKAACNISHFGSQQASELLNGIIQRLPEYEQEIRFLLDREKWRDYYSTGVARNYSHLLSVGRPVIVFDDDAICALYASPVDDQSIEFSDGRKEAFFFENLEEQEHLRIKEQGDPVQQHMRFLGLTVPEALYVLGIKNLEQSAFAKSRPDYASRISRDTKILVSEFGTFGNPGTANFNWLGTVPEQTLRRLISDEKQIELALRQSRCWLGVNRPTFTPSAHISQITGFDNRMYLPPYFPIERGQDHIFGDVTRYIYPESVALIQPKAALHLRMDSRTSPNSPGPSHNPDGFPGRLTSLPMGKAENCRATDPFDRLQHLSQSFRDLSDCDVHTVLGLYSDVMLFQESNYLNKIQTSFEKSRGAPDNWIEYLRRSIGDSQEIMQSQHVYPDLAGRPGQADEKELISFWQGCWGEFGQALLAWRKIRLEAASLIEGGSR
jgi:hypothetical protein